MRVPGHLRRHDLRRPSASKWNGLVDFVLKNRAHLSLSGGGRDPFPHPWEVFVERWTDAQEELNVDVDRTWKVSVSPGTVNDELATMLYKRTGDERGWVMPTDYPAPKSGQFGYHPTFIDRALLDALDDAPFLLITAPPAGTSVLSGLDARGFATVPDSQRLAYFRSEELKEKKLYVAFVVVSADPGTIERYMPQVRVPLRRFRVFAGQRPSLAAARAGSYRELARLYLTRDAEGDPALDRVYVQQKIDWCLGSMVAQADLPPFPDTGGLDPIADLIVEVAQGGIDSLLEDSAFTEWWTT